MTLAPAARVCSSPACWLRRRPRLRAQSRRARRSSSCPSTIPTQEATPHLDARRRGDPAERNAGGERRSRDRSRGAAAGLRSTAVAGRRDAEPRVDDQGRAGGDARRSWSAARSRCKAISWSRAPASCASIAAGCCRKSKPAGRSPICSACSAGSRSRSAACRRAAAAGRRSAAADAAGVRALRQGPGGRNAVDGAGVSRAGAQGGAAVRSRRAWRSGICIPKPREHQRALDAVTPIRADSRFSREGRFRRSLSLMNLKRFDDALETLRAMQKEERVGDRGQRDRRRGAAPRRDAATGPRDVLLQPGLGARSERRRSVLQSRLRLLARQGSAGGDLLAARSGAARSRRWRCALHSRRRAAADRRDRRSGARARAGRAAVVEVRADGRRSAARRRSGAARPRASARRAAAVARARRQHDHHARASAIRRTSRRSISMPAAARSSAKPIARRSRSCGARCICRRTSPRRTCCSGRLYLRGGRPAEAVEALKIALWSEETVAAHVSLAEALLQVQDQAAARVEVDRALALDPKSRRGPGAEGEAGRSVVKFCSDFALMASTHDDSFREIQLSGKQLVFLFMAVVVIARRDFPVGVLVGRGVLAGTGRPGRRGDRRRRRSRAAPAAIVRDARHRRPRRRPPARSSVMPSGSDRPSPRRNS